MMFYGDTGLMYGMILPTCSECGDSMTPKVFMGHVYGWRCKNCSPDYQQMWASAPEGGKEGK